MRIAVSNSVVFIKGIEKLSEEEARGWPKVIDSLEKLNLIQVLLALSSGEPQCFVD